MSIFSDILGTTAAYFKLGLSGVRLKNSSANLIIRNTDDSADAELTASKVNVSGNSIVINSDSTSSGSDYKYTISRPATGMTADVSLVYPVDDGTAGQVMVTDGSGVLSWQSAASTALCDKVDTTSLAFGSTSPVAMITTGANDVINKIQVIVDTAFNGTVPTLSIGTAGTTSKYVTTTHVDLKTAGVYEINPGVVAAGVESIIATYAASTSSAGAARIQVYYATPA